MVISPKRSKQPGQPSQPKQLSPRKQAIRDLADRMAPERDAWIARSAHYHEEDLKYLSFLVPQGLRVLVLGGDIGLVLDRLKPLQGVGVSLSEGMIALARERYPQHEFHAGDIEDPQVLHALKGPFDVIVLVDMIGLLEDCEAMLASLQPLCGSDTRVVIAYWSHLWEPILRLASVFGHRMPQVAENWLSAADVSNLLNLADFEIIKREWRQLLPKRLLGLGTVINRYIATLPLIRQFCLRNYIVARILPKRGKQALSVSVIVPCRNEKGNIEATVERLPHFAEDMEVLFVEGHSNDGTLEECSRVRDQYADRDIKVLVQDGKGKGDAVRKGFEAARGDVLMILDADLTVPPEVLPKFHNAIERGKGEFINGTRLVYPMEKGAMRFLNFLANRAFAVIFSFLLNQRFSDTLCGTKVLRRSDYLHIAANRAYFGDFDPFGDFDLIFGAAKLNLKIAEIPIRYAERSYGKTQISRFQHGWLLLRMVIFAWRKLKAF
jgi:hypothetical protein